MFDINYTIVYKGVLMLIRSFLPVGQGAFYCECFAGIDNDNVNVVYDCGSLPDKGVVEREIKNNFREGEKIDAVVISHLDEDHVNGIPFLLKYCEVKRIYFPLITQENKTFMKIKYKINNISGFPYDFLENPYEAIKSISSESQLFAVREEGEDQGNVGDNIPTVESGRNLSGDIGRDDFPRRYGQWLYIPFNFRQRSRIEDLLNNLEKNFGKRITAGEVEDLWKDNSNGDRDNIRAAYKKVPGGLNTNSMVLFSGVTNDILRQFKYSCRGLRCDCFLKCHHRPAGCLYMGDYDASGKNKWDRLVNAYRKYWKWIGCVQIPHHGSCHNFNDNFLNMDAFFVVSAGYKNRYRHPHGNVLKRLLMTGHVPHIVTELVGSAAYFKVY